MDIILERIIESMEVKGVKKIDLTNHLGMVSSAFGNWVAERNKSYTKYLYQIADYLGVSVEYLKGETDEKGIKKSAPEGAEDGGLFSATDREFFKKWARLSEEDKKTMLLLLDRIEAEQ